jgi:hypothetical protein
MLTRLYPSRLPQVGNSVLSGQLKGNWSGRGRTPRRERVRSDLFVPFLGSTNPQREGCRRPDLRIRTSSGLTGGLASITGNWETRRDSVFRLSLVGWETVVRPAGIREDGWRLGGSGISAPPTASDKVLAPRGAAPDAGCHLPGPAANVGLSMKCLPHTIETPYGASL